MARDDNKVALEGLANLDGYIGSCLVDSDSGMVLAMDGGGAHFNLEIAIVCPSGRPGTKKAARYPVAARDGPLLSPYGRTPASE